MNEKESVRRHDAKPSGVEINIKERFPQELARFLRFPALFPPLYLNWMKRRKEMREDVTTKDIFDTVKETPEFYSLIQRNGAMAGVVMDKALDILVAKGMVQKTAEADFTDAAGNVLTREECLNRVTDYEFTQEEQAELNRIFYDAVDKDQTLGLRLPRVKHENQTEEAETEKIDYEHCRTVFYRWQEEAIEYLSTFMTQIVGPDQTISLPERIRTMEPYTLVLLTQREGVQAYEAGKLLEIIKNLGKLSQHVSDEDEVTFFASLDRELQKDVDAVIAVLEEYVQSKDADGELQFAHADISVYVDPDDQYQGKIVAYELPEEKGGAQPYTVFASKDPRIGEIVVNQSLADLQSNGVDAHSLHVRHVEGRVDKPQELVITEKALVEVRELLARTTTDDVHQALLQAKRGEICRVFKGRDGEPVYFILESGPKPRFSALTKYLRGSLELDQLYDLRRMRITFLNLLDAQNGFSVIENAIRDHMSPKDPLTKRPVYTPRITDNLITGFQREMEPATQSSEKKRFRAQRITAHVPHRKKTIRFETQQSTVLSEEEGISEIAHWRYRLRQYYADFLDIIFPREVYGEYFNISRHLSALERFYQEELNDTDRVENMQKEERERLKRESVNPDDLPEFQDLRIFIERVFIPAFIREKLIQDWRKNHFIEEVMPEVTPQTTGLLELEESHVPEEIRDAVKSLKQAMNIIMYRTGVELEEVLKGVDRTPQRVREILENHREEDIFQTAVEFITDPMFFKKPEIQENSE